MSRLQSQTGGLAPQRRANSSMGMLTLQELLSPACAMAADQQLLHLTQVSHEPEQGARAAGLQPLLRLGSVILW
jgi:hypothetical protein